MKTIAARNRIGRTGRHRAAQAQSYPTRSVTVIVPFAAGGPADITGRIAADIFSRASRPAVRGRERRRRRRRTGTTRVARAAPDGYTIGLGHMGTHAAAVALDPEPRLQAGRSISSRSG